jgi:hypothetical protein
MGEECCGHEKETCEDCGKEPCECKCEECGKEPCECEEDIEELVHENDLALNVLIDLLVEKGVFTEEEFDKKVDSYGEEE